MPSLVTISCATVLAMNDKGFFLDIDIHAIDRETLGLIGAHWQSFASIEFGEIEGQSWGDSCANDGILSESIPR